MAKIRFKSTIHSGYEFITSRTSNYGEIRSPVETLYCRFPSIFDASPNASPMQVRVFSIWERRPGLAQISSTITCSDISEIKFDQQCSVRVKFVTRPLNPEITFQTSNSSRGLFLTFLFYLFNRIEIIIFQNDSITVREHSTSQFSSPSAVELFVPFNHADTVNSISGSSTIDFCS